MASKVKVIDAAEMLTNEEVEAYEYWLALQSCLPWLYEEPKDNESKELMRDFLVFYSKIKAAMKEVVPGKVCIRLGKSKTDKGKDLVVAGGWYDTAQKEADFAVSLFTAYLSFIVGDRAQKGHIKKIEKGMKFYQDRIKKLGEDINRREMRILDLENAVSKLAEENKSLRRKTANAGKGRLQSKRPERVKTTQVRFNGKRRV